MSGLRPLLAAPARVLLDVCLAVALIALWVAGSPARWLVVAFVAFAGRVYSDIREHKRVGRERDEARARHRQKLDALEQSAGGLADDFNNLLTAISGNAELAAGAARGDAVLLRYLDGIQSAAGEAAGLTAQLLTFGRQNSEERSPSIASAPDHGTTVTAPAVARPASTAKRVLVVEDREIVRELAQNILADAGFEVVAAPNGDEALTISASSERFDLVLTDVVMPQMSGPELARVLRERFAGLPVLYMSGYTGDILDASALTEPETAFLRKPFTNAELVAKVRELLDTASTTAAEDP
jgi:CheY-like chemotaxis protein